jgi:hypothetical protein
MANPKTKKLRFMAASTVALAAATVGMVGSGCNSDGGVAGVECESVRDYYAFNVHEVVMSKCFACHNLQGIASETDFVLKGPNDPGFIENNVAVIKTVSSFERDGESQWLLKPTQAIPHEGGAVVDQNSDEYKRLLGMVVRLKNDEVCESGADGTFTGVEMMDAPHTLRKASIMLAGRLPSADEISRVEAGGFAALEEVLDEMMTEEAFLDFVKTGYGDIFQTDFYIQNNGLDLLEDVYADPFWFENAEKGLLQQYNLASTDELARFTNIGIAREPLELVSYIVKNNLPFTEIITADYSVFTPFSSRSFGAEMIEEFAGNDPFEYKPGRYPSYTTSTGEEAPFPHAGVLTNPMFLARWPTTATNRNRARARIFLKFFLGFDILKTAEQPVDQTAVTVLNPQRDDPACSVCHTVIDPIAGTFQAFHFYGDGTDGVDSQTEAWLPEPDWYAEMWPPGFGGADLPAPQNSYGLQWLASQAVKDDKFALGAVYNAYLGLTGKEPLIAPEDFSDPLYDSQFRAFLAQANTFRGVAEKFKEADYNFKVVVRELVMSPYFRAMNSVKLSEQEAVALSDVGMGRLLTPKQLHKKVLAVLGIPWGSTNNPNLTHTPRDPAESGQYQLYYGGVDFSDVTTRITEPNGLMAAVAERMAIQMSCAAVPTDFSRLPADRKLFPTVEIEGTVYDPMELQPESGGLEVPQAIQGIKETIRSLHKHILGENLPVTDEEVERTYQLFVETWREGSALVGQEVDGLPNDLPGQCQSTEEYFSGTALPEEQQVISDENYVVRSWMAVLTYLLSDYKFLYE